MKRLLPSSLLGQVMASVALALLVAQIVSVTLLYRAGEDRREAAILTAAALQLVNGAERAERAERTQALREERRARRADRAERRGERLSDRSGRRGNRRLDNRQPNSPGGLPRPLRYTVTSEAPIQASDAAAGGQREERLREILALENIEPHGVAVTARRAGDDPVLLEFAETRPRFNLRTEWRERRLFVVAIQREEGGPWEAVRIFDPARPRAALGVLLFQTLLTFGFLIIILFLVLRRITRPLAMLTDRVSDFSRRPDRVVLLEESGPSDTRRLIAAHNAMEARIAALLDEKNVMLGAIGHDLKTPLAALRVRIESVPDDTQRGKMAGTIEDITATLDDILSLARVGRPGSHDMLGLEPVDLGALTTGIAEEFEDLGEPVTIEEMGTETGRVVAMVQATWIKRALRNLVTNAVRYGGGARLTVLEDGGAAILRIEDDGPGIPEGLIADMMEPFTRGEASRNRATGGAGLGLTLARAIAQQHGGELKLSNRAEGGLRAELRLPL
ncbi:sensor histidine kinase [Sulfitobacter sp.]|uniref:sensor histidine kinase n=1 Tax=Sulfitobacter sp. TaxID=1903071 RepID=UPI003EF4AE04